LISPVRLLASLSPSIEHQYLCSPAGSRSCGVSAPAHELTERSLPFADAAVSFFYGVIHGNFEKNFDTHQKILHYGERTRSSKLCWRRILDVVVL
jgi:hypothetical protein